MKKLTAVKIEKTTYTPIKSKDAENPGVLLGNRISDPEYSGLYLHIPPHGSTSFRFDFRYPPGTKGKRQCLTYRQYPRLSLAEAREMPYRESAILPMAQTPPRRSRAEAEDH